MRRLFTILALLPYALWGLCDFDALAEDLATAKYWDDRLYEWFPLTYTHIGTLGYYVTPSARMAKPGELGGGYAYAPPYQNWIAHVQPFANIAFSYAYRIFTGVPDVTLTNGFGDVADRGANFKIGIITPEQTGYMLPGVAFGIEDFFGSKVFRNYFLVGTYVFPTFGAEVSLGWGGGRYTGGPSRGFFGGFSWYPWWRCENFWIKGFGAAAEYDPTNYADPKIEPHPDGHISHSPINFGVEYQLGEVLYLSASQIRGDQFACAATAHLNFGDIENLVPKRKDPPLYKSPLNHEPLGCYRPEEVMIQELGYLLREQGFWLHCASLERRCEECYLRIQIRNDCYRHEEVVRKRLEKLLASVIPSNLDGVVVVLESYALPCQEYVYPRDALQRELDRRIHPFELQVLTPRGDVTPMCGDPLYCCRYNCLDWAVFPQYSSYMGSSSGKYKYDIRLSGLTEGYLPKGIYYNVMLNWSAIANIQSMGDKIIVHPSTLPIVATDLINYQKQGIINWERLYAQKSWNFGKGNFGRVALGYFQVNYAGLAGEWLFYPAQAYFAIGLEGAVLKKRSFNGFGFKDKLDRWEGTTTLKLVPYSTLQQYFLSLYLDIPELQVSAKASIGQFLAYDKGGYIEAVRYFDNGLRLGGYMTFTNAEDLVHGVNYYNRGIILEIPLDFFQWKSSRKVYSRQTAAWLRDAGYWSSTGVSLYNIVTKERRW
ncbi:MAG: YjbH domain-containing protein [Chlamydiales bacterium]|nr:YjbH domain-containing protein [Chlamydiales bacterium]